MTPGNNTKVHDLKLADCYFDSVKNGLKRFEIRYDDRGYSEGDILRLYRTVDGERTQDFVEVRVLYMLKHEDFPAGIPDGYCVMSIEVIG